MRSYMSTKNQHGIGMDHLVHAVISLIDVGGHDRAFKGRVHGIVSFIGRNTGILTAQQQSYNDVHEWSRAGLSNRFCSFVALVFSEEHLACQSK